MILWRPAAKRYQKGLITAQPESGRQSGDQRDGVVSIATADHSASPARVSTPKRRVAPRVMQSKAGGTASSGPPEGVVVLCPLRSWFTKDHRGNLISRFFTPGPTTTPATHLRGAPGYTPAPFVAHQPTDARARAAKARLQRSTVSIGISQHPYISEVSRPCRAHPKTLRRYQGTLFCKRSR